MFSLTDFGRKSKSKPLRGKVETRYSDLTDKLQQHREPLSSLMYSI